VVWNESSLGIGAGGGGFSVVYDEAPYQQGTIHGGKQRPVPDVSYNAAVLHGVLTYLDIPGGPVGFFLFGGTSAGSPQWAAMLALVDQKAGYDLGFINKALYHIGQAQNFYSASFFDITSGNNSAFGVPGFTAGTGWDAASGLGSPAAGQLSADLIQFVSPVTGRPRLLRRRLIQVATNPLPDRCRHTKSRGRPYVMHPVRLTFRPTTERQ